jgi:predicted PurR-regulated permease PerM
MGWHRIDHRLGDGGFVVLRPLLSAILWAVILSFSTWPIYTLIDQAVGG